MEKSFLTQTEWSRWLTEKATDAWEDITFNSDSFENNKAPEPVVSFSIGAGLAGVTAIWWFLRWKKLVESDELTKQLRSCEGNMFVWSLAPSIRALSTNDSVAFAMLRMGAQTFLFLGGFQQNYQQAFWIIIIILALEIAVDATTTIVYANYQAKGKTTLEHTTTSIYDGFDRSFLLTLIFFGAQSLLIVFLLTQTYDRETMVARDGTPGVPIVGTLGSYLLYLLGFLLQCVILLGPRVGYGLSATIRDFQFWGKVWRVTSSSSKAQFEYTHSAKQKEQSIPLQKGDPVVWLRFGMTSFVNGFGYHTLNHLIPIFAASQATVAGVISVALGIGYLFSLDKSSGGSDVRLVMDDGVKQDKKDASDKSDGENRKSTSSKDAATLIEEAQEQARLLEKEMAEKASKIHEQLQKDLSDLEIRHVAKNDEVA